MEYFTKIIHNDVEPVCERSDCFACEYGNCTILTNNDFGERECPFYKTEKDGSSVHADLARGNRCEAAISASRELQI